MIEPLARLRKIIKENKLDAALISSISNIVYLTSYSGFSKEEREAYLLVRKDGQCILTDGRYSEAIKKYVKGFKLIEVSSKISFEKALKNLMKKHKIKKLGFEGHNISFLEHETLSSRFNDLPAGKAGLNHFSSTNLRAVKSREEISKIEKACELGDKTFDYVLKKVQLGISEKELAFEIEFFIKKNGADISFPPIVAFGKNSAIPHHQTSNKNLEKNDKFVLLDFGVKLNNYCSDMTRTVFLGKASREQKKMYETVLNAQQKVIDYLTQHCHSELARLVAKRVSESKIKTRSRNKFWMTGKEVDKIARDYIVSRGYPTIPHSLGHGVGLQVHESPRLSSKSKDILKEGMIFSIEPGIYIPNLSGVRIEDLIVLEKSGPRLLTKSPKHLIEL